MIQCKYLDSGPLVISGVLSCLIGFGTGVCELYMRRFVRRNRFVFRLLYQSGILRSLRQVVESVIHVLRRVGFLSHWIAMYKNASWRTLRWRFPHPAHAQG